MPDHEWRGGSLFLGERQELRRQLKQSITVERDVARNPKAVEDRE